MGRCKQLLPINGRPAIIHCLANLLAGAPERVVVVVGHNRQEILDRLKGLPVHIAVNPAGEGQMTDSVQQGLSVMPPEASGIIVALCDHPLVLPRTYRLLRQHHERHPKKILQSCHRGRGGHPVLFPRPLLQEVESGKPMNRIMADHYSRVQPIEVDDPGIMHDMDYQEDYYRLLSLAAEQAAKTAEGPGI